MKQSSIIIEGSIKGNDAKNNINIDRGDDVSPPSSPTRQIQTSNNNNLRGRWTHNPLVLSMVACSTMQTCDEVKDVFTDCLAKNDNDSMMCEAAEKYYKMCAMKSKNSNNGGGMDNSSVLNFSPYHEDA